MRKPPHLRRYALNYLENDWLRSPARKPLIIHGARQVGKTWLVRTLADYQKLNLIELNFESDSSLKSLFLSNEPLEILTNLEAYYGKSISPENSLLFLDEIQDAPEILEKLRWLYEKLPTLPVISAGSFLSFILNDHAGSMPVGRVQHLYVEPLSFTEFLYALHEDNLVTFLTNVKPPFNIPEAIHARLQKLFREYLFVGGMPEAVENWVQTQSIQSVTQIQQDLLTSYRRDFFKYKGRYDVINLDTLLNAIPTQLGTKFTVSKADPNLKSAAAQQILSLFTMAKIAHRVNCASGSGLPLAGEINRKFNKYIFLDVGLVNRFLGSNPILMTTAIEGKIAEQVAGQALRTLFERYQEPELFYWQRAKKGSDAEIDYLIAHDTDVIPVEIKAGSTGRLKSLHLFMKEKKLELAVRINNDYPSLTPVKTKALDGSSIAYTLLSIPFYLIERLPELLSKTNLKQRSNP